MQKQQIRRQLAGQRSSKELHNIYIYIYRNILCSEGSPPRAHDPPDGRQRNRKKKT